MLTVILNGLMVIYLLYCIQKILKSLKQTYDRKEMNYIINGALLGIVGSTTVSIFSKTIVGLLDLISGG